MPLTAGSPQAAAWWTRQRGLSTAAAVAVQALWDDRVDPDAVLASWAEALPAVMRILAAAGTAAASGASGYVDSLVTAAGLAPGSAETLVPSAFVDPESMARALHVPGIRVLRRIGEGQPPGDAMAAGRRLAGTIAAQRTADAGRDAVSAAIVAEPRITGWIRVLRTPSCGRCAILAGRVYAWSDGFQRHPRCDCVHEPLVEGQPIPRVLSPGAYFESLTTEEQDRLFGKDTAAAIRDGTPMNEAVNADRGMWRSSAPSSRNVYEPRRPAVASALAQAGGDRAKAAAILRQQGYFAERTPIPRPGSRRRGAPAALAADQSASSAPRLTQRAAEQAIRDAEAMARNVHPIAIDPDVTVTNAVSAPQARGEYQLSAPGRPARFALGADDEQTPLSALHELGHYVDEYLIGSRGEYASEVGDPVLAGWAGAVERSDHSDDLRSRARSPRTEYLRSKRELFARAYAQWVALRTGDDGLRALVDARIAAGDHWGWYDFGEIATAMDTLFGVSS